MENIKTNHTEKQRPRYLIPTFDIQDVLGIHTESLEIECGENSHIDIKFHDDPVGTHLGLFIAGVLGDLQHIHPLEAFEDGVIRVKQKTAIVIERAGIEFSIVTQDACETLVFERSL